MPYEGIKDSPEYTCYNCNTPMAKKDIVTTVQVSRHVMAEFCSRVCYEDWLQVP